MRVLIIALAVGLGLGLPFSHEAKAAPSLTSSLKEPANIFSPHIKEISASLPPGWVMRLPSQLTVGNNAQVLSSSSQARLTVNIFKCQEQQANCLVSSITLASEKEFQQHKNIGTLITLTNNIQGYLYKSEFSEVMWQQDNQFYKFRIKEQSPESLLA
jgi:hypothetical protein